MNKWSSPDYYISPQLTELIAQIGFKESSGRGATMLKVRSAMQATTKPAPVLTERFVVPKQTVQKSWHSNSAMDRRYKPRRLQTTLTPTQQAVSVALRRTLLVSFNDLWAGVSEFVNPNPSRFDLDGGMRRHSTENLRDPKATALYPTHSCFTPSEPGYNHVDVKYLPPTADESARCHLFVAIDRARRCIFICVFKTKTTANEGRFLRYLEYTCQLRIRTGLTDNGCELTERLFDLRKRAAIVEHELGPLSATFRTGHRLKPPKSLQTNGIVGLYNGQIKRNAAKPSVPIRRRTENGALPLRQAQSWMGSTTHLQAMKDERKLKPAAFNRQPYYQAKGEFNIHCPSNMEQIVENLE